MKELYLRSIYNQYIGLRDQSLADLTNLLENSAGIGEHGEVGEEIKRILEKVDRYDSLASTMSKFLTAPKDEGKEVEQK